MHNLTFQDLTSDQVLRIADGLADGDFYTLALRICDSALTRETNAFMRYRLRMRIGFLRNPNEQSQMALGILRDLEKKHAPVFVGAGLATWMKTVPFLGDERFMALEEKHQGLLPIANWHWNLQTVVWALQQTRDVEGDLLELGVFKGHTTQFTADYMDFQSWPKTWRLIDTFDGIPDDQVDPGWAEINKAVYKGTYAYEDVVKRFAPYPNIHVIRGRVPEALDEHAPEKLSFLHIDLNNTAAELAALERLVDRLSPGGVLILDDYCWASAYQQHAAERRWFGDRGLHVLPLPTGQGVFVKR
jgi:hypothetical protein